MRIYRKKIVGLFVIAALMLVSACGESGDSFSPAVAATTTITGSVFAAPVAGAAVTVKDATGNIIAGPVNTANDGTYSVDVPAGALASDLRMESGAGTFIDEATGTATAGGTMAAYVSGGTLTAGSVHIDPSSTIIHALVTGSGKTHGEANAIFNAAFGYTPDTSVAPKNAPPSGSDTPQRLAGLRAGVFSQLTRDMNLTADKQFELLTALAQDLADDGAMNGSAGSVNGTSIPEDIQNRFERALVSFQTNTSCNLTGLTADQIGDLPFAKVALTNTYRVEYIPGTMPAQGKTTFKIKITNRSDGSAATGLAVSLMLKMYMSTANHGTPADLVAESATPGTYDCTVYYLMASGAGMGYWEMQVMMGSGITAETAVFHPRVGMAMGTDAIIQRLYGPADIVSMPSGTQYTKYVLFRDGPVVAASGTLNLMISHAENMMMNFMPVSTGSVLSSPTGTVTSMIVSASTDPAFTSPAIGANNGNGHWTITGLSGLVSAQSTTIYVKLKVNGEDKTTNGSAAAGSNAYAPYLVTPQ
jgi:hypothetical protein